MDTSKNKRVKRQTNVRIKKKIDTKGNGKQSHGQEADDIYHVMDHHGLESHNHQTNQQNTQKRRCKPLTWTYVGSIAVAINIGNARCNSCRQ